MKRVLREPLLHFFIIGVALFSIYSWMHRNLPSAPSEIIVSSGQVQSLQQQFERVWQRPPTRDELKGLIDGWVKEEVFYREGMAMALDRDDPVVRRRVEQKLEFILDSAVPESASDAQLQAWLDAHPDHYQIEPTYSLRQVFFDPKRHRDKLDADIIAARRSLESGQHVEGDTTLLPQEMKDARATEVAQIFGNEFVEGLSTAALDHWYGPIRSGFGVHLVEVSERHTEGRALLKDVRAEVERDFLHARSEDAKAAVYEKLRGNYRVRFDDVRTASSPAG